MSNNEQKKNIPKAPRAFTPEEIQILKAHRKKHKKMMEIDPEYRKLWDKREADFKKIALLNDSMET